MDWLPLQELAAKVNAGELTAAAMVSKALEAIEAGKRYDAIIEVSRDRALSRAQAIDEQISAGSQAGRLAGVPFIAKDNFLTLGGHTTAASNILRPFRAPYQASAIEKLEAEGAICVAKANLDAFAHGSSTENSDWFVTKNPHDISKVAGGSSGGSVAAVVLGMVPFALGTDTGGSVRLPASFCGAVGYKPTYGLISRSGVVAMASSTDVIGPISGRVEDVALLVDIMAGKDAYDSTTIERDGQTYVPDPGATFAGVKVGIVKEYMAQGLDGGVRTVIDDSVKKIAAAGADVELVSLPSLPLALAVYYIVCPAEVASNLSRYDGQRYGYSDPGAANLEDSYVLSRSNGFGAEAKRRIMIGTYVLSSGYFDAYYKKAQTVRTKIIREFQAAFKTYDVLVGPTSPTTAFGIGQNTSDPLQMYLTDIMTVAANISGLPSISLPAGKSPDDTMPVGLQLIAGSGRDKQLLGYSYAAQELFK